MSPRPKFPAMRPRFAAARFLSAPVVASALALGFALLTAPVSAATAPVRAPESGSAVAGPQPGLPASSPSRTEAPRPGAQAPGFTLPDAQGQAHSLADYRGKWVVLEWVNYDCPFVKKHYGSGNMQKLQADARAKGAVWLSINSSAPGKQGHFEGGELAKRMSAVKARPDAYLQDPEGKVGKAYQAKTTPTLFVIDPAGQVTYAGAIDDKPSTDQEDIPKARNYVRAALEAGWAGKPVETASAPSYGCGVKYGD